MAWYGTRKAAKLASMDKRRILVFDVETTGLSPTLDEILQITILDGYGSELFSSYIKPIRHRVWPAAQVINGISYAMVKNAPTFKKVKKEIQEIFNNAQLVVGYNVGFDIGFIEAAGIVVSGTRFDVMTAFASYRAAVDHTIYRKCKLSECAEYFGHSFNPHDSASDARATLHCFDSLIQDKRFTTYKRKEKVQLRTETPVVKKKTRFTVAFKSGKRRSIAVGLVLFVAGAFALISWSKIVIKNWDDIKLLLGYIKDHFMSDPKVMIAVIAVVIGGLMVLSRLLRMIMLFPKWVLVHIQRIVKRIRGLFD